MGAAPNTQSSLLWVRPSRLARRLFLHLFVIGVGRLPAARQFQPFEKPGAGLSWVESGHGWLRLETERWELKPGPQFWFYGTHRPRWFSPTPGKPLVTRLFWFGGPALEAWLEELDVYRQPCFRPRRPALIYRAHDRLYQLAQRRPAEWEQEVHRVLSSVLLELLRTRNPAHDSEALPDGITRALNAIEADPSRDWQARELATQAGMSYSSFRASFRATMRETPHQYIQRTRLDFARELLANQRLRIKEVAQQLHFANEHYFSAFFRKKTGVTPSDFRKVLGVEAS